MEQNTKRIGLINWIFLLAGVIAMLLIARYVGSMAAMVGTLLLGFAAYVALMSFFQMSLIEREQFERLELDELSKSRGSESLFAEAGDDTFPARRSRELFEKFFVPGLTTLLFLLQAGGAYLMWTKVSTLGPIISERATLAMSLLGLLGLILFVLGKYSTGLVRLEGHRLLRPGATFMLLSAYVCFVVTGTIAASLAGMVQADIIVAKALCIVMALIAAETLLGLIMEIYRVRVSGRERRVLYESRLAGLMGQPEAIFLTARQTLDYQFGFKVSETWLFQYFEKAILWLILAQLAILALSTCVVVVRTGDEALLERFGQPVGENGVIGPGLHFKLPWPIDQTIPYHTDQVQTFIVGAEPEVRSTIVWKVAHAKEENFLVASRGNSPLQLTNDLNVVKSPPVNLLSVSIPVQYRITNLASWAYINKNPESLLKGVALRQVVHYLASADFDEVMSRGRGAAAVTLRENMQAAADKLQLGAKVTFVGLEDIHPPQKVAEIFEKVVGAAENREAKILDAQAYVFTTNAAAIAQSSNLVWGAEAGEHRDRVVSEAQATLFTNQSHAYAMAPGANGIYEERARMAVWVNSSRKARKYIMGTTNTPDVMIFNLEDKIRPDLGDQLTAPPPSK